MAGGIVYQNWALKSPSTAVLAKSMPGSSPRALSQRLPKWPAYRNTPELFAPRSPCCGRPQTRPPHCAAHSQRKNGGGCRPNIFRQNCCSVSLPPSMRSPVDQSAMTICDPSGMTNNSPAGSSARRFVKYLSNLLAATDLTMASRSPVFPLTTKRIVVAALFIPERMNVSHFQLVGLARSECQNLQALGRNGAVALGFVWCACLWRF